MLIRTLFIVAIIGGAGCSPSLPFLNTTTEIQSSPTESVSSSSSEDLKTDTNKKMNIELFPLQGLTLAKAKLGLEFQKLGTDIARAMALPFDSGFVLSNLDSRYSDVKIKRGDMLFKVGNKVILKDEDFQRLFATLKPGIDIDVVFLRVTFEDGVSKVEVINDKIPISLIQ